MIFRTPEKKKGFVLVFAVLVGSVLLSIGLGIFTITLQQVVLSAAGRESQFAFYAADAGAECALYWDIRQFIFATSTDSTITPQGSAKYCNEQDITNPTTGWDNVSGWTISNLTSISATTVFDMSFGNGACATVTVIKQGGTTQIDARGYNTCNLADTRRVERALRVRY